MDDGTDALDEFGPRMACLDARERAFVRAMLDYPTAKREKWSRLAGYGGPNATPLSLRVTGHQVAHRPRVQEAVREETDKLVRLGGAIGIAGLIRLAQDPKARGHQRALDSLADRAGLVAEQQINVNHHHTDMTGKAMEERIRALAAKHGLDPVKLLGGASAPVLELPATEVKDADRG